MINFECGPREGGELMANLLNEAKTLRNLVHNSGAWNSGPFLYTTAGSRVSEFWDAANHVSFGRNPVSVDLKPGATIYRDDVTVLAPVQGGAGFSWTLDQPMAATLTRYQ